MEERMQVSPVQCETSAAKWLKTWAVNWLFESILSWDMNVRGRILRLICFEGAISLGYNIHLFFVVVVVVSLSVNFERLIIIYSRFTRKKKEEREDASLLQHNHAILRIHHSSQLLVHYSLFYRFQLVRIFCFLSCKQWLSAAETWIGGVQIYRNNSNSRWIHASHGHTYLSCFCYM